MAHSQDRTPEDPAVNVELATFGPDSDTEDAYWQSAYPERPYARADRSYEYYRAAYRYGAERAMQTVTNYDTHVWENGSFWSAAGATRTSIRPNGRCTTPA